MSQHLLNDLEQLKKGVLDIGTLVEEGLSHAITAMNNRDRRLAEKVIAGDAEIDRREVVVEEECLKILALHQPVARDLRYVVAILKLNNDLERVGDLAANIAERAVALCAFEPLPIPPDLNLMAQKAAVMVKKSFDALVDSDPSQAAEVRASDDEVDSLQRDLFKMLQDGIRQTPQRVEVYIHLMSVTRYLERIADQATNIAEDVIYMVHGNVVRHRTE